MMYWGQSTSGWDYVLTALNPLVVGFLRSLVGVDGVFMIIPPWFCRSDR
jgi:hypothetical protein